MTTSSPPDVIDVIPVLKPDQDDEPTLLQRWRAAWLRRRWTVVGAVVLLVLAAIVWRTTRPQPFVLTGQVEAQEINLVAPGAGVITRLLVLPGQEIDAGSPLFELDGAGGPGGAAAAQAAPGDPAAAAASAASAAAAAAAATAASAAAASAASAAMATVPAVTPAVLQARADLDRSRVDTARFERAAELAYAAYQRAVGLYEDSMIESGARDVAQQQWNTADAQVRAARTRHDQVRRRVEAVLAAAPQRTVVVAAPAAAPASAPAPARAVSVAAAAGAAGVAGRQTLRAPLAGEIDRIGVTAGTRVAPGQWLMSLLNLSDVWVVAVVREDRLATYAFGTRHQVEIPVLSARLELRVDSLSQLPDFATWRGIGGAELRSFEVRLRSDAALPGLRPGMAVVFAPR
jgi:HlyD family secretion protein